MDGTMSISLEATETELPNFQPSIGPLGPGLCPLENELTLGNLSVAPLTRHVPKHCRGKYPVSLQIPRCSRTRDASCRASSREQIGKPRSVLTLDATGRINRESALSVKQSARHFGCMIRRATQLVRKKFPAETILAAREF